MINGIIGIYKEKGFTSHDVVAKMRGILHQKKIGHTGTLDPDAEGVLPVCLGAGTKLCDMLTDKNKTYRTVMLLGMETDTQDISGTVLAARNVDTTEEQIKEVILDFVGEYDQIPPMYSALKVNGKKLYELAREGKTVTREARKVTIFNIQIEEIKLPYVTMTVECSKGTYIRTLCHDIGQILGCGGCMAELTRTKVGMFEVENCIKLDQLQKLAEDPDREKLLSVIIPVEEMFSSYARVQVKKETERLLLNGNALLKEHFTDSILSCDGDQPIRVYDASGTFCGIYRYRRTKQQYQPVKMFLDCRN